MEVVMKEKKRRGGCHTNMTEAMLIASANSAILEEKTIGPLKPAAIFVGMYLSLRIARHGNGRYSFFYPSLNAIAKDIARRTESTNLMAKSSLSEALNALHSWGIIDYNVQAQLPNEITGIRISINKEALTHVRSMIVK